jgi:hypothetical protein
MASIYLNLFSITIILVLIGITAWAITAPCIVFDNDGLKEEVYTYKTCINGVCNDSVDATVDIYARVLLVLYSLVILFAILIIVSIVIDSYKLKNIAYICLSIIFIPIIVIIVMNTNDSPYSENENGKTGKTGKSGKTGKIDISKQYSNSASSTAMIIIIIITYLSSLVLLANGNELKSSKFILKKIRL